MSDVDVRSLEVELFVEAIRRRYDYDLGLYARSFLARRLDALCARSGGVSLGELQHRVLVDRDAFFVLLEDLTVRVTQMFRDPEVFEAFRRVVVPMLRTYPSLKIWHAGCASGEEVVSMAIVLTEADLYERSHIYATDLSPAALAIARDGVYPADRWSGFAANYASAGGVADFSSYVTSKYGNVAIVETLRRNVLYFQHNLVADHALGEMHVIFCRNVLIYYDRALKARMLRTFVESLRPGGVLCLGASERLLPDELAVGFRELERGTRLYRFDPREDRLRTSRRALDREGA